MSKGLNKSLLIGNLCANPELRQTNSGTSVVELRIATNDEYKDKDGQWQESAEYHSVIVWGRSGEACAENLSSGDPVYVEGKLKTRSWEDNEGNKKYKTEIVANPGGVIFLGKGSGGGDVAAEEAPAPKRRRRPAGRGSRKTRPAADVNTDWMDETDGE